MNNVDSSPQLKKQKSCFNSSLSVLTGLLFGLLTILMPGISGLQAAEDSAAPPKTGEATQTEEAVSPPPALPPDAPRDTDDSRNIPQPEVTIIYRKEMRVEEYRINGRLRYVKFIPKKGKPYYLVDKDGDGQLESRHDDLDGMPPLNEWIMLEW